MSSLDTIRGIPRAYRRLERYRQILHVFVRYGFGSFVDSLRSRFSHGIWKRLLFWRRERGLSLDSGQWESVAYRLRQAFVELGPTFVKLGQILSTRQDIIPAAFIAELSRLQDSVPAFSFDIVRSLIRTELGAELEDIFSEFDEVPVGAASMAQGHRARLKDGTEVFVKLQRPGIERIVKVDLEILSHLATVVSRHSKELAHLRLERIISSFSRSLLEELDFAHERSNQEKFARQFSGRAGLRVPHVFSEYCTHKILVMEYIRGIRGTDVAALRASGLDLKRLSEIGADIVLEQFFEHGFYHADPHPGNIFFLPGNEICYVDFGQMGRVTEHERESCAKLLQELVLSDYHACTLTLLELTEHDDTLDLDELERVIGDYAEMYMHGELGKLNVPSALTELYEVCKRERIYLKPQLYIFLKALGVSDSLGRAMNPDFVIMRQVRPHVIRMAVRRVRPKRLLREVQHGIEDWARLVQDSPRMLHEFGRQLTEGRASMRLEVESIDKMNTVFNRVFNRLSSAIVLASMIIGSSIVVHANPLPHWHGTSIVGVVGFLLSAFFCMLLLLDIWKNRHK